MAVARITEFRETKAMEAPSHTYCTISYHGVPCMHDEMFVNKETYISISFPPINGTVGLFFPDDDEHRKRVIGELVGRIIAPGRCIALACRPQIPLPDQG